MGLSDMSNNGFDADAARYDRQNMLNPSEFPPGQGVAGDTGDIFSSATMPVGNNDMGDIFASNPTQGNGGGGDLFAPFNNVSQMPGGLNGMQPPMQQKDQADVFWDVSKKIGKEFLGIIKDVSQSFKKLTPRFWNAYGYKVMLVGGVCVVIGFVGRLFGWEDGLKVCAGGCLSAACGVILLLFNAEAAKRCDGMYIDSAEEVGSTKSDENFNMPSLGDIGSNSMDMSTSVSFGGESVNTSDGDTDYDKWSEDWDDDFSGMTESPVQVQAMSPEEALDSMPDIQRGMYTRQYLYDMFTKVLESIKPDFASVKEYDEDSDIFLEWDDILRKVASVLGAKEDNTLYLKRLEETIFTIRLTINRVKGLKPEMIADEIANVYAFRAYTDDEERSKVSAKTDVVLDDCIITVFTGENHLISLKDMYQSCSDKVLNNKNLMPVVLGVDEKGQVSFIDMLNVESMIVAGMPRSGKSWLIQAILAQMCAYLSPNDINFYILDAKGDTSDFRSFTVPHVKKFACKFTSDTGMVVNPEYPGVLETLREVVNIEAPRRKRIIGNANCVNINDFRKKYPDVKLPYLYIVIDEMVTLSKMEKEQEKEYQSYLDMIVTQFPNLGIRGLFIPHEIKNQVISKTAYDSVKARVSVNGSAEHIEASTGTKAKDFPFKLRNKGDMAVRIDTLSARTKFVHGVALSDSNEKNADLMSYLRRMWIKLEPDCASNPVVQSAELKSGNDRALEGFDLDRSDDTDLGLFRDADAHGVSGFSDASLLPDDENLDDIFG